FKDASKLFTSYIPPKLPHRDKQLRQLQSFFSYRLKFPQVVQLEGPAGTGKTSSSLLLATMLKASTKTLYVNLKVYRKKFLMYKALLEQVEPDAGLKIRSYSPEELLVYLLKTISKDHEYDYLFIVDEIDNFIKGGDTSVVYELTRLNEVFPGERLNVRGVIFISRDPEWRDLLDSAEKSSLGALIIKYDRYTKEQLTDILEYRASLALKPGTYTDEIIDYIADVVAEEANSDVRFALDVLYYSALTAEREGAEKVEIEHVRNVVGYLVPGLTSEDLSLLEKVEMIGLLSIAYTLKLRGEPYVGFLDISKVYEETCRRYGLRPNIRTLENTIQKLHDLGFITFKGIKRIGVNVPLDKLINFLETRIESEI
ncbi:MAG: hypothetical protein DRJ38_09225, partial [Thermoprotei archaeon]